MDIRLSEIEALNQKIGAEYRSIDNRPLFRIIWSESAYENRHGTFREFTESGLFIREVTETRRVRKYNYIHNRWIFEAWAPGNLTANRETPDACNGDYVPVYVFESKTGEYLPPIEKAIRFLIAAFYGKVKKDKIPSQAYLEEREIQQQVESMDDHPAWFQTRPGEARNAVWHPGINEPARDSRIQQAEIIRAEAGRIIDAEERERNLIQTQVPDLQLDKEAGEPLVGPDGVMGSPYHRS